MRTPRCCSRWSKPTVSCPLRTSTLCSITAIAEVEVKVMILNVDLASDVPIYQQLRDQIVEAIAEGVLIDGSSLPATRTLAADFGINFHTVNKAYDLLRQQGLIQLNRKTGAVVTPAVADPPFPAEWTARART